MTQERVKIPSIREIEKQTNQNQKDNLLWERWGLEPLYFATEAVGFEPTDQQALYFLELGKLFRAKVKNSNSIKLTKEEEGYAGKWGISIRAAKGVGKDAVLAITQLWFLMLPVQTQMICTGPDANTLKNVLVKEVTKWLNRRNSEGKYSVIPMIRENIIVQVDKIYKRQEDRKMNGKVDFVEFRTAAVKTSEDDNEISTIRGRHERFMITAVEEASEVDDSVIKTLMSSMTQHVNFGILIWNPTRRRGYAYETHFGDIASRWIRFNWSAIDSRLVTVESIRDKEEIYGKNSSEYRISVLGELPIENDNTLILHDWVEDASRKRFDVEEAHPVILGVDCSGMGKDRLAVAPRQGPNVYEIRTCPKLNSTEQTAYVLDCVREYNAFAVMVDSIGYGWAVYEKLRDLITRCYSVNVGVASDKPQFDRLRDELWWDLRTKFETGMISIPKDPILKNELSNIKKSGTVLTKIKIESKESMKKRLKVSPDRADALVLSLYLEKTFSRFYKSGLLERYSGSRLRRVEYPTRTSWMSS